MLPSRTKLYVSGFLALVILIGGYVLFQARNIIIGPVVKIENPISGAVVDNPLVSISGVARNVSYISLNDRPIFIDEEGNFKEKLLVSPGYSIMTIVARDRFDRTTKEVIELVYR
ncbi:hypothetical protein CL631_01930 [bacterium]|jgi:hypothetical protein|nr:hypothetical protein [bacterium]|tara:strand:+ start:15708 stop:16052 length:345 start_codon:yes stop_codon:yes gene_type:complete